MFGSGDKKIDVLGTGSSREEAICARLLIENTIYISTQDVAFNAHFFKNTIQRKRRYQSSVEVFVPFIVYYYINYILSLKSRTQ